ncbi:MAG TPA: c-type cytochrome [Verrucomicrobiota bacterium]|nr:c-type cytochrome [Verrucomicrobiota bacterium]
MKRLLVIPALLAALSARAADVDVSKLPPAASRSDVTYEKDIKPIFDKACVDCHGAEKQKAKLRLDTLEWIKKGMRGDDVLGKGKSADSLLVHSIARLDEDLAMPPEGKGDPLTKEEIGLVRAWIDHGAK